MRYEGKVVSIFLSNGDRFMAVEFNDPRYTATAQKQTIIVKDNEQTRQLGNSIKVIVEAQSD